MDVQLIKMTKNIDLKAYNYLETPSNNTLSPEEIEKHTRDLVQDYINNDFGTVLVPNSLVSLAKEMIDVWQSNVDIATIIGYKLGELPVNTKIELAQTAISDGAQLLVFVFDHSALAGGKIDLTKKEYIKCTQVAMKSEKKVVWLYNHELISEEKSKVLFNLILDLNNENFEENLISKIEIKSISEYLV